MWHERWRREVVQMVRGRAEVRASWFTGSEELEPVERLGIYQQQYRLRMLEALEDQAPGLARLVGDGARELLWCFIDEVPSNHWTLSRVVRGLPEWLEARDAPGALVDMARLDLAVAHAFTAAEGTELEPASLSEGTRLVLVPHAVLLWLEHDVQRVRPALLADQSATPRPGTVPLVVFRRGEEVRHRVLDAGAWRVLRALSEPRTLPEALEQVVREGTSEEELAARVGEWFQLFASRGLVQPA